VSDHAECVFILSWSAGSVWPSENRQLISTMTYCVNWCLQRHCKASEKNYGEFRVHRALDIPIKTLSWCELLFKSLSIVWSISTCASLPRRVLKFDFQVNISLESWAFGKLGRSNWIWLCGFKK
jgi:hypothetical protein